MYSEEYKNTLCLVCRQSALLHYLLKHQDEVRVTKEFVDKQFAALGAAQNDFLEAKIALGFSDGLSFLKDEPSFTTFRFKNGQIEGEMDDVYKVVSRWLELPEEEKSHFRYESATLILSTYFIEKGMYPDIEIKKRGKVDLFLRKVFKRKKRRK